MAKTKKWKVILAVMLAALFMLTLGLALHFVAHAAEVTVTVQTDGNGTVSYNGSQSQKDKDSSITVSANPGEEVKLIANAEEGFVFAYWYVDENTPLSYEEEYSYTMPEDSTTIHAKFFDINEGKITTTAEGWVNDGEKGTYTLKSEDEYNFESGQNIPIYFEFVGEKWFTFDYKLSLNTAGDYYGSLSVIVDGAKYLSKSFNAVDLNAQLNLIFKASGNTYHRVEIIFQTPKDNRSGSTSSAIPTALEFVLSNISLKNESEYETTQATVNWDAYLGEAYYISGILNTTAETAAEFIISKGTKIDNKDGKGTVTVPVGVPVAFAVKPYEKVTSRIDPDQQVNVHLDGIHYALGQGYKGMDLGTTGDELIFYFDAEGNVLDSGKTFKTEIYLNLREFAVLPKIFYTATIDNSAQEKKELHDKDDIELKYEQLNDILFEIEQNGFEKNEKFAMTINGEQASVISDGDMCGFTLNGIGENKDIVITPYYGEEFYPVSFEFSISMLLNGGIDDIILDSSADVSVENDEAYPWFFDPGRNSGDGYAFISGISYLDTITAPSFSQLKFTVVGNGSLTFEYHIDGYSAKNIEATNHNSWAAYSIGKKVYAAKCTTGTTTGVDWRAYGGTDGGFKKEIATNLGYGNSYMDYADVVTYYEPGGTSNSVKIDDPEGTKDRDKYWYKATIPIKVEQETEQTEIYIAHAIGVSSKPKCANMTVRNVAFYKGDVTVNWAVNNAEGSEGSTLNKINVTGTDKQGKVSAGTVLQFTAVPADNNSFYCWKNGDGEVLSYDTTYKVTVGGGDLDIRGIFDTSGTYAVRIDDKFYKPGEIENAFSDASSNKKDVIVVDNISLNGITIPAGVNLVIPYNRAGASYAKGTTDNATDKISWAGTTYKDPVYKLTLTGDNKIFGSLIVGGVLHYPNQSAQGHTSGAYSQLILDGTIEVEEGGLLDVYGLVTGEGGITVKSGGVLYQPFLILDYAGGSNTYDLFYLNQTPFKRYAMINVQCKKGYTIEYGGELYGHASLYFLSSITTLDTQFISFEGTINVGTQTKKGTKTLINLKDKAKVTGIYKAEKFVSSGGGNTENIGQTTLTITGGASAGYMNFLDMVQTDNVAFSIPYNYALVLEDGTYDLSYDFKLMPGASLTVGEGATLNLNAKFLVYDGLVQSKMSGKGYPTADELTTAKYATNANFIVNGKFNINQGATFLGVIQTTDTTGTAKITVAKSGEEREGKKVVLSGKIIDGGETDYDCNYFEYDTSARIWVKTVDGVGKFIDLEEGKTYTSTYEDGKTFTLPAANVVYESGDWGSSNAMKGIENCNNGADGKCDYCHVEYEKDNTHINEEKRHHAHADDGSKTYKTDKTKEVAGLKGSWMIAHTAAEHEYDWTPTDDEKAENFFQAGNAQVITRYCTIDGCTEHAQKYLLKSGLSLEKEYNGGEFDKAALFKELYGDIAAQAGAELSIENGISTIKNAGTYTIKVELSGGFFLVGDEFAESATFTFEVGKKALTVTINDQSKTYDGNSPAASTAKGVGYTAEDLIDGDSLEVEIAFAAADVKAGEYKMTATAVNGNYDITVEYTHGDYSVYKIEKAALTVEIGGSTPKEEELEYTITVTGYVASDLQKGLHLLNEDTDGWKSLITVAGVDKNSEPATYTLQLSWTGGAAPELDNYTVGFAASNTYEIIDPLFADVGFTLDGTAQSGATIEAEYDGKAHTVGIANADGMQIEWGGDALTQKDAGTYNITVKVTKDGYDQEFSVTFKIAKRSVTVELIAQSKIYDGEQVAPSSEMGKDWKLASGSAALADGDDAAALGISIVVSGNNGANVNTYALTASADSKNYNVIFKDSVTTTTFEIEKKLLNVTVKDIVSTYGDGDTAEKHAKDFEYDESELIAGDKIAITLDFGAVNLKVANKDGYAVVGNAAAGSEQNDNYDIRFKNGTWKVNPKGITIVITPVTVTYSGAEPAKPTAWTFKEGSALAAGDNNGGLNVVLTKAAGADAGKYNITGVWNNANYEVTFEGGENAYTIEKADVSGTGDFFIMADDVTSVADTLTVNYAGEDITITGYVLLNQTQLAVTLSKDTISGIGEFDLTVTVNEKNYVGSKTFRVKVRNADGYTERLVNTLAQLEEITKGLTAQTLKAEDFEALKQVVNLIAQLDEEEKTTGAAALAPYEALVSAWNEAAEGLDNVISTAQGIAQSMLDGLFGVAAAFDAFAAAAYVLGKGGIL